MLAAPLPLPSAPHLPPLTAAPQHTPGGVRRQQGLLPTLCVVPQDRPPAGCAGGTRGASHCAGLLPRRRPAGIGLLGPVSAWCTVQAGAATWSSRRALVSMAEQGGIAELHQGRCRFWASVAAAAGQGSTLPACLVPLPCLQHSADVGCVQRQGRGGGAAAPGRGSVCSCCQRPGKCTHKCMPMMCW